MIIIDAFDECGNIDSRKEALELLTQRAHELPIGVRLIVTSRYEEDVQTALKPETQDACLVKMEDIPGESTRRDIHAYVRETLQDVRGLGSEEYVPKLAELALAAEESFQWALTACRFIKSVDDGNATKSPKFRLDEVLKLKAGLDPLYQTILDGHFGAADLEELQPLRTILGSLVYAREPLSLRAIVDLVADSPATHNSVSVHKFDLDDYHRLSQKLSSLVTGTHNLETPLVSLHTSFTDFLGDKARSQIYFTDELSFNKRVASGCLECMHEHLEFNICKLSTSFKRNDEIDNIKRLIQDHISIALSYACRYWPYHLSRITGWADSELFGGLVVKVLSDWVLEWLEVISLTGSSALDQLEPIADTKVIHIYWTHCCQC